MRIAFSCYYKNEKEKKKNFPDEKININNNNLNNHLNCCNFDNIPYEKEYFSTNIKLNKYRNYLEKEKIEQTLRNLNSEYKKKEIDYFKYSLTNLKRRNLFNSRTFYQYKKSNFQ